MLDYNKRLLCFVALFLNIFIFSQHFENKSFKVSGSCSMCKERIETVATKMGALNAIWESKTQTLTFQVDAHQEIEVDDILKEIAMKGHDNEKYQAPDEVFQNLPMCCHYSRNFKNRSKQHEEKKIESVELTAHKNAISLNKKEAGLVFEIQQKELLKAACCNLSESFETNATVDVSFNNAVTGGKQLKMLGLDHKYTSITEELLPEVRGLSTMYGLNFIPGRWIQGLQLTKGGSSVVNGYESITGQINTELVKFNEKNKNSLNIFTDSDNRQEINVVHTSPIEEHWKQSILLHGNMTSKKSDHNADGFLDRPIGHQINTAYLLDFLDLDHTGWASHSGIQFLSDRRTAGQVDFNAKIPQVSQNLYGVGIDISQLQVWNKTGYIFQGKPYQSIGLMNRFTVHEQNSFFGLKQYFGKQKTFYSNLVFESIIGDTRHKYKTGVSFLYDDYHEDFIHKNYQRTEKVPGVFFEYIHTGKKYTLVAGLRSDFHNLAGTQFSPRFNFKYDITPKSILRISAGRGFRTANVFAENQQYFTSNRNVMILSNQGNVYGLKPEIAWNYGVSFQQEFKAFNRKSTFLIDVFKTDFFQQVLTDIDESAHQILFYNLNGKSYANSFQAQWDFQPLKNFEIRTAYKYYDVQADYLSGRREVPFVAKQRAFINLAYSTVKTNKNSFWAFDTTVNWIGKKRIPDTQNNPTPFQLPQYSSPYITVNFQISKNFNQHIRGYLGVENLTNTVQKKAILDAKNPFGNYFDAGMIYAPIMKRLFYIGIDLDF